MLKRLVIVVLFLLSIGLFFSCDSLWQVESESTGVSVNIEIPQFMNQPNLSVLRDVNDGNDISSYEATVSLINEDNTSFISQTVSIKDFAKINVTFKNVPIGKKLSAKIEILDVDSDDSPLIFRARSHSTVIGNSENILKTKPNALFITTNGSGYVCGDTSIQLPVQSLRTALDKTVEMMSDGGILISGATVYLQDYTPVFKSELNAIKLAYPTLIIEGIELVDDEDTGSGVGDGETYTIIYHLDDGINNEKNPAEYTIETPTITLINPTKTGCTFAGWFTESEFTNEITDIKNGSSGNLNLHAKWTPITHTVTFNANGGTNAPSSQSIVYNNLVSTPTSSPSRTDYSFGNRWYKDDTYSEYWDFSTDKVTTDITLYAQWTIGNVTATRSNNIITINPTTEEGGVSINDALERLASGTDSNNLRDTVVRIEINGKDGIKIKPESNCDSLFGGISDGNGSYVSFENLESIIGLEYLDTSDVNNMAYMFESCFKLSTLDLTSFDTSNVTTIEYMFHSCKAIESINISGWNANKITNMEAAFGECPLLTTLNISCWSANSVTDVKDLFYGENYSMKKEYIDYTDTILSETLRNSIDKLE